MRRATVVLVTLLTVLLFAPAAHALKWRAYTGMSVRLIPRPEPREARVAAKGFHQVRITQISVQDRVFPIFMRIDAGDLVEMNEYRGHCEVGWQSAADTLDLRCTTSSVTDPCESAWWQGITVGRLVGHPAGGVKVDFTQAVFVDCECV